MKALIDGDILRYEIGFGAETMAKAIDGPDALPDWDLVANHLEARLQEILLNTKSDAYQIYLSEGPNFRDALAVSRPYKGNRIEKKPWHFKNLTAHMVNVLNAQVVQHVEADDQLAIDHLASGGQTVLCSRDKDLRQIPGFFYSWELGHQPSFGPTIITPLGELTKRDRKKLDGCGYKFFCAQMLMGDVTDNIPGLPGYGPVAAFNLLDEATTEKECADIVAEQYEIEDQPDAYLLEQGRLCWITHRLHPDGTPVLWERGMLS